MSALRFMQDELLLGGEDEAQSAWAQHGVGEAIKAIVDAHQSLELEGFNVSVPPHLRPGVPQTHVWWAARPPIHASGRLHYC